jgi:hypothetical protein
LVCRPLVIGVILGLCVVQAHNVVEIPLQASLWTGPSRLANTPNGSLTWDLHGVGYTLTKPATKASKKKPGVVLPSLLEATTLVFSARIVTTGEPRFQYGFGPSNPCLTPANLRPILWATGNDWYDEFARWWPRTTLPLASIPESVTVRVPMEPSHWTSVYGKGPSVDADAMAGWLRMLAHPGSIGFTAGGGCFYGHGVWVVNGTAHFELQDYHFE